MSDEPRRKHWQFKAFVDACSGLSTVLAPEGTQMSEHDWADIR